MSSEAEFDCQAFEHLNRSKRVIRLLGRISTEMVTSFVKQQREFYELNKKGPREVAIVLSTYGGSIADGMVLYNAIDSFRKGGVDKLWLIGQGYVGSMGVSLLPAQPDRALRRVYPHTTLYHHRVSLTKEGRSMEIYENTTMTSSNIRPWYRGAEIRCAS